MTSVTDRESPLQEQSTSGGIGPDAASSGVDAPRLGVGHLAFGRFTLDRAGRQLRLDGETVQLGGRAFDLLTTLVEKTGEVVGKRELMERIWPDVTVDEGSLRFHLVRLRRALADGADGSEIVTTVTGRGYSFVAPITAVAPDVRRAVPQPVVTTGGQVRPGFPPALARMVGRDREVEVIAALLDVSRIVTIVGTGGIGKTTVALAVAHSRLARQEGFTSFVDLSTLADPMLIEGAIATAIGLVVQSGDVGAALSAFLRERSGMLVLDNCEHLIDAVADLAARIHASSPNVAILATSREALTIEGERVHPLPPLETPPEEAGLKADAILRYPAVRLFVDRIEASGLTIDLTDEDAPLVADVCRKLDGVALAIELAAGRVQVFGLEGMAKLLDSRMRLLWRGMRTAPSRHQTLAATLDWSYSLLSDVERRVLDRMSVFVGGYDLDAAEAVVGDRELDRGEVHEAVAGLLGKSLLASRMTPSGLRYHLLQTTRSYILERAADHEDLDELRTGHARYYRNLAGEGGTFEGNARSSLDEHVPNLRAAMEWSLSNAGDPTLGLETAAAGTGALLSLSLLGECRTWCERALATLDVATTGSRAEMEVQSAFGLSSMFTRGNGEDVRRALTRALELAVSLGDDYRQMQILGTRNTFHTRLCEFTAAVATSREAERVAARIGTSKAVMTAEWMLGVSLQGAGDQAEAQRYCEASIRAAPVDGKLDASHLGYDHRLRALMALGRCLWLQGEVSRGRELLEEAMREADRLGDPVTASIVMMYTVPVHIWMEEWDLADALALRQIAHAREHGLGPYEAVGIGLRGEMAVRRGELAAGIPMLRIALDRLKAEKHKWWLGVFLCALADGLNGTDDPAGARGAVEEAMEALRVDGETWFAAEILRTAASVELAADPAAPLGEALLREALAIARRQSALAWEVRAATDLAQVLQSRGLTGDARTALEPALARFSDSSPTPDVATALTLMAELGSATR